jgi:uncharacterized protein YqeY
MRAAAEEKKLYENYLPTMLSREQLELAVSMLNDDVEITIKNMKVIKERLDAKMPGQIDGRLLAGVIKDVAEGPQLA